MAPTPTRRKQASSPPAKPRPRRPQREVYDGDGNLQEAPAPRLIPGDDSELRRQIVEKRKEIKGARSKYSSAGSAVKTLLDELEELLEEADRRSALEGEPQEGLAV